LTAIDGEKRLCIAYARIPHVAASTCLLSLGLVPPRKTAQYNDRAVRAYFEEWKLELDQHFESLLHLVKRTVDGLAEHDG
jgi:hypothetical protein